MSQQPGGRRRLSDLSGTSPDRLSGISDGIFAVGMTLLVLGLVVPVLNGSSTTEGQLWQALQNLGPSILVYTTSFMTLGIFWLGQGTQLAQLSRSNRSYVWIHLVFLFAVTMVPGRAEMAHLMRGRILIAQSLYAGATALCVIFPTWVSIALIILIQLNYVLAPRIPILHRF